MDHVERFLMSLLTRMGEYMLWADERIWNIVKTLTDEEFSQTSHNNCGSIGDRYLHMARGHSQWYHRWINQEYLEIDFETFSRDELFSYLSSINSKIVTLIQGDGIEAAQIPTSSHDIVLRLDEMVFNIINHATYHRGQIITLLRMLGKDVVVTDYFPYLLAISQE